jgi:hypothetical protein
MINHNRIIYRFNEGDNYDGTPINAYWRTPVTDLKKKSVIKKPKILALRAEEIKGEVILIHSFVDRFTEYQRHQIPKEPTSVLEIPLMNEGRTFSFRILNEAGSRWRISGGIQLLYESKERVV